MADIVFTPLADVKEFPENVDVTLVEGAVANEDHFHFIQTVRARSRLLIAFGDCAVTGNVTALRNPLGSALPVLQRGYLELADVHPQIPSETRHRAASAGARAAGASGGAGRFLHARLSAAGRAHPRGAGSRVAGQTPH